MAVLGDRAMLTGVLKISVKLEFSHFDVCMDTVYQFLVASTMLGIPDFHFPNLFCSRCTRIFWNGWTLTDDFETFKHSSDMTGGSLLSVSSTVSEISSIRRPSSTAAATTPVCVPSAASGCRSWTHKQASLRTTATSGWRSDTGGQVQEPYNVWNKWGGG